MQTSDRMTFPWIHCSRAAVISFSYSPLSESPILSETHFPLLKVLRKQEGICCHGMTKEWGQTSGATRYPLRPDVMWASTLTGGYLGPPTSARCQHVSHCDQGVMGPMVRRSFWKKEGTRAARPSQF